MVLVVDRVSPCPSPACRHARLHPSPALQPSAIQKIVDINITAAVLLAQAAVPHMRRGGSLVFVSSYTAFAPCPPIAMYAVSKTALLGLTKALAEELGPDGIRVNCIAPGIVPTKVEWAPGVWRGWSLGFDSR